MSEANVEIIRRHYEIRHGKGRKRREVGGDDWNWEHPRPWIALVRRCRSVRCSASSTDRRADSRGRAPPHAQLRRLAAEAGVRRRFAPHQLRHAHAVELARERVPLNVIQRQLGHANLGTTSVCLQGIDTEEIIATRPRATGPDDVRHRRAATLSDPTAKRERPGAAASSTSKQASARAPPGAPPVVLALRRTCVTPSARRLGGCGALRRRGAGATVVQAARLDSATTRSPARRS
jgi:hypothetical protein